MSEDPPHWVTPQRSNARLDISEGFYLSFRSGELSSTLRNILSSDFRDSLQGLNLDMAKNSSSTVRLYLSGLASFIVLQKSTTSVRYRGIIISKRSGLLREARRSSVMGPSIICLSIATGFVLLHPIIL